MPQTPHKTRNSREKYFHFRAAAEVEVGEEVAVGVDRSIEPASTTSSPTPDSMSRGPSISATASSRCSGIAACSTKRWFSLSPTTIPPSLYPTTKVTKAATGSSSGQVARTRTGRFRMRARMKATRDCGDNSVRGTSLMY